MLASQYGALTVCFIAISLRLQPVLHMLWLTLGPSILVPTSLQWTRKCILVASVSDDHHVLGKVRSHAITKSEEHMKCPGIYTPNFGTNINVTLQPTVKYYKIQHRLRQSAT